MVLFNNYCSKYSKKILFSTSSKKDFLLTKGTKPLVLDLETSFLSSWIFKKFISLIMQDGKKFKSEKILKKILVGISLKRYSPSSIVLLAVNNVKPIVDVRIVRRRGKSFRVPFPLKNKRQITKAIQILLRVSKNKKIFENLLIEELINSAKGRSRSIKATLRLHKFAFQNRAFSNYRWF